MRILLVEDHLDSLDVMRRILERYHHEVTTVTTLADAVRTCISGKFDLALCDIGLPDGDGWEFAKVARQCECKAIALTGFGMPHEVAKAKAAGFVEHIVKPVGVQELLSAVDRASGKV
jgi:CheY-like chemotaxis protein